MTNDPYEAVRRRMVAVDLKGRGIRDRQVLAAMEKVRREAFVPGEMRRFAYDDRPLPIGYEQTISQPYMVALMTTLAEPGDDRRVLEIGTGSGYQAAVLAETFGEVVTIERIGRLADEAGDRLAKLGYDRIAVVEGDGTNGYPPSAPYDAIVVAAAVETIPSAFEEQLVEGGRLIVPLVTPGGQTLMRGVKMDGKLIYERRQAVRFVPFVTGTRRS